VEAGNSTEGRFREDRPIKKKSVKKDNEKKTHKTQSESRTEADPNDRHTRSPHANPQTDRFYTSPSAPSRETFFHVMRLMARKNKKQEIDSIARNKSLTKFN